ncbi:MAG TPA: TIM barrel protein [Bryobacteraceae bacterium]|nr:TIM barrel protein [Bryobacteraceae bacterium]
MTRRTFVPSLAGLALAELGHAADEQPVVRKGKLKQCVTRGVFGKGMSFEDMCRHAARMGCKGFDLVNPPDWPTLKKYGLVPTMVYSGATIPDGLNRVENHAKIEPLMKKAIDDCASIGAPNVITFSGNRKGQPDAQGMENCVLFLNKIKAYAEDKGVTICMEFLNSKVNHPDYQFDHTPYGVEICKRVNSPRVKILYDMYHVQIMDGDIIRNVRNNIQWIGHFHTAGNPGRHEMDDTQEMNYKGIAKAIADLNFTGYVAHEYSPTRDPLKSLEETLQMFDVS